MKKVLSVILAIMMIATAMPMVFAVEEDEALEKLDELISESFAYGYCVYYPVTFPENYDMELFSELIDIGYKDVELSKEYFINNPDAIEPVSGAFQKIVDYGYEWTTNGYEDYEGLPVVIIDVTGLVAQAREYLKIIGEQDANVIAQVLPETTGELLLSKVNTVYEIHKSAYDAVEKLQYVDRLPITSYTGYTQADFDVAAQELLGILKEIADCKEGKHNSAICIDNGDGTHSVDCSFCGFYTDSMIHIFYEYEDNGDGTKTAKCICCDATDTVEAEIPFDELNFYEKLIELIKNFLELLKEFFESVLA